MVREAVGPEVQICFDVHTRLDTAHAISLCRELEPYRPFFIEDPLRSENPASYRTLARHVSLPIAAGEQWPNKWAFREVIEEELISYARIDVCNVGGLTEALKITHWCETHYIDIVPHNPLGPVSAAACVPCAWPPPTWACRRCRRGRVAPTSTCTRSRSAGATAMPSPRPGRG